MSMEVIRSKLNYSAKKNLYERLKAWFHAASERASWLGQSLEHVTAQGQASDWHPSAMVQRGTVPLALNQNYFTRDSKWYAL